MERFVRRQNVEHYQNLLKTLTDPEERQKIQRLLEEEQKKQRDAGDKVDES